MRGWGTYLLKAVVEGVVCLSSGLRLCEIMLCEVRVEVLTFLKQSLKLYEVIIEVGR